MDLNASLSDQSSSTKKLCLDHVDLDSLSDEKVETSGENEKTKTVVGVGSGSEGNVVCKMTMKGVKIKVEKPNP